MRFYTLPPSADIKYPYLFVPMRKWRVLLGRRGWVHAIVDSGILIFKKRGVVDYPRPFLKSYHYWARLVTEAFKGRVWVVIPDYPDDYNPGAIGDNVGKTLRNVERFVDLEGVEWLPVVQSSFLDLRSFADSCARTAEVLGEGYPRVAIGTVCKTNNLSFIVRCCSIARMHFPDAWIHAFGLTLRALPRVANLIDSFDSMAWTFPRTRWLSSYRNLLEGKRYFEAYLRKVEEKLRTPQRAITDFLCAHAPWPPPSTSGPSGPPRSARPARDPSAWR